MDSSLGRSSRREIAVSRRLLKALKLILFSLQVDALRTEIGQVREKIANKDSESIDSIRESFQALQQKSLKLFEMAYKKVGLLGRCRILSAHFHALSGVATGLWGNCSPPLFCKNGAQDFFGIDEKIGGGWGSNLDTLDD